MKLLLQSLRVPCVKRLIGASRWRLYAALVMLSASIASLVFVQYWASSSSVSATVWTRVSMWLSKGSSGVANPQSAALPVFCTPEPPVARYPPSKTD